MVAAGKADLEFGMTTHVLRRLEQIDLSLSVVIDGGGVVVPRCSSIVELRGIGVRKVAVARVTTNAEHFEEAMKKRSSNPQIVLAEDRKRHGDARPSAHLTRYHGMFA
jgi:hypothetical protein